MLKIMYQMMRLCTLRNNALFCLFFYVCVTTAQCPLTILFIVGHFPSPSQTFILNQMTRFIERGHNVLIFSFHHDADVYVHPDIIKYGLFECLIPPYITIDELPDCDIVLCQFGYLGRKVISPKSRLSSWLKNKKIVTCFRGADTSSKVRQRPRMYKKLFKKGHLFLPVCDFFKERLIKLGCPKNRIIVHYSAIDCSKFLFKKRSYPEDDVVKFISVSRLVEKKGLDFAIKAMAKIVNTHPNVQFTIVGDGPERERLQQLIDQFNLNEHVFLCGWKTQEEVVALLDESHIFVLPSIKAMDGNVEGIPNALKEAMAMGMPVIATFHAGNKELIIDGISGYLVPQRSSIELHKKMEYVLEHPQEWEAIGINARNTIEQRFEINKNIEKLEKLFYELLKK